MKKILIERLALALALAAGAWYLWWLLDVKFFNFVE